MTLAARSPHKCYRGRVLSHIIAAAMSAFLRGGARELNELQRMLNTSARQQRYCQPSMRL